MIDVHQFEPLWGEWRFVKPIGRGNYGTVYLARREEMGAEFFAAIKHIPIPKEEDLAPEGSSGRWVDESVSTAAYYQRLLTSLQNEILVNDRLKGNANIAAYEEHKFIQRSSGVGFDLFIKMELLKSLPEHMQEAPLTVEDILRVGEDISSALVALENERIIHRDIKASNILIHKSGSFKLCDFGVARVMEQSQNNMTRVGTPTYISPEVYFNWHSDHRLDIYSLGLLLYRFLNENRAPFLPLPPGIPDPRQEEDALRLRLNGEALPDPAHADPELSKIILKACAFYPEDRYASASELKSALAEYRENCSPEKKAFVAFSLLQDSEKRGPIPETEIDNESTPNLPAEPAAPAVPEMDDEKTVLLEKSFFEDDEGTVLLENVPEGLYKDLGIPGDSQPEPTGEQPAENELETAPESGETEVSESGTEYSDDGEAPEDEREEAGTNNGGETLSAGALTGKEAGAAKEAGQAEEKVAPAALKSKKAFDLSAFHKKKVQEDAAPAEKKDKKDILPFAVLGAGILIVVIVIVILLKQLGGSQGAGEPQPPENTGTETVNVAVEPTASAEIVEDTLQTLVSDNAVRKGVAAALGVSEDEAVTERQLQEVEELYLNLDQVGKVSDLKDLELLTGLVMVNLSGQTLDDIDNLDRLSGLKRLNISDCVCGDLSFIGELTTLTALDMRNTDSSDISALYTLIRLSYLNIAGNNIVSLAPLSELEDLETLIADGNPVEDWSFVDHVPSVSGRPEEKEENAPPPAAASPAPSAPAGTATPRPTPTPTPTPEKESPAPPSPSPSEEIKVIAVTGVGISKSTAMLEIGELLSLSATVSPSDATNQALSWSSSDSSVVTVDGNGNVRAIGTGTAVVTVSCGGFSASCVISVA